MPIAALEGAERHGWRVFVLGASEEVNAAAVAEIRRRYPRLILAGRMNGYEPEEARFAAIAETRPDLVMAALGSPRQELFAARLVERIPGVFVVGCGGALDVLAGRTQRAPRFMVDHGLEWLYRLTKEPYRWRRQRVLPLYLARLMAEALRPPNRRSSGS
jgi:N-acetylglucosaminyldiphosphoundecaprenol N-acetyl-beta-D-mannosaminyltransferase